MRIYGSDLRRSYAGPLVQAKPAPVTRAAAPTPTPAPRTQTVADVSTHVRLEIEHKAIMRYRDRLYSKGANASISWQQLQQMLG